MWAAWPVLAAFLVEYPFYLVPTSPILRKHLRGRILPLYLVASVLLPYLICYAPVAQVHGMAVVRLAGLALVLGLWYLFLPPHAATDLAFLGVLAAVLLGKFLDPVYPAPFPGLKLAILGQLALIHMSTLVLLGQREVQPVGFGLLPSPRDVRVGIVHYLAFLPVGGVLAFALKAVRLAPPAPLWKTAATFLGFLLVVAWFEEFLFRGVLQQWLEEWTWHRGAALGLTAAIFGLAHLWFRGFPNWRWALLAGVLGWFCGHARNQAGSIRAGIVTHTLVVTTWRAFFV